MANLKARPLFYLHVRGPEFEILDLDGSPYADLTALNAALMAGARDMLGHDLLEGRPLDMRCRIDAERDGEIVATLAFKDAVVFLT